MVKNVKKNKKAAKRGRPKKSGEWRVESTHAHILRRHFMEEEAAWRRWLLSLDISGLWLHSLTHAHTPFWLSNTHTHARTYTHMLHTCIEVAHVSGARKRDGRWGERQVAEKNEPTKSRPSVRRREEMGKHSEAERSFKRFSTEVFLPLRRENLIVAPLGLAFRN